jgi:putative redox protein
MATVTVHGGASGFRQEIVAGTHRLLADEPQSGGGADAGPSPYDFLLAALGA